MQLALVNQKSPLRWYVYSLKYSFSKLIRMNFSTAFYQNCLLFAGNKLFVKMQVRFCCSEKSSCLCMKCNEWNKMKITEVVIKIVNVCIIELHWNYCKWCCYIVKLVTISPGTAQSLLEPFLLDLQQIMVEYFSHYCHRSSNWAGSDLSYWLALSIKV